MLTTLPAIAVLALCGQRRPETGAPAVACTKVIELRAGKVHDIDVSRDGKRLLVGCDDGHVFVVDVESGDVVKDLTLGDAAVMDVEFDARGEQLLGVQFAGTQVWNARTFEQVRTFREQKLSMLRASFSPDGTQATTASCGNGAEPSQETEARVWSLASGEATAIVGGMAYRVHSHFRPDGLALLVSSENAHFAVVRRLDRTATETRLTGHSADIAWSAWSPDGEMVLTVSSDFTGRLWDAKSGATKHVLRGHTGFMLMGEFSPDGKQASTTSWVDRTTRIWTVKTGKERLVLSGHAERPTEAHFAPNGRALASFDASGIGLLFELEHGTAMGRFTGHTDLVSALTFTPDSKRVVTGSWDGTVRLWANPLVK